MPYFVGIDGGQSSTTLLIADETGRVVGTGRGGPCNHVSSEEAAERFTGVITGCLEQAVSAAGIPRNSVFESVCCGMSGGPNDKSEILMRVLSAKRLRIVTDFEIALTGATAGEPGVMVAAGTGSVAYGRNSNRATARAGGWGHIFGDDGGAFDIARHALRAALRFEEGWGPPTAIHDAFLERTGAASMNDLLHWFYTPEWPRSRIASLSALVDQVASSGDLVARGVLQTGAQELASLAGAVRAQLFPEAGGVTVAYTGGVFSSSILLHRFEALIELADGCSCVPAMLSPGGGALIEAYRADGLTTVPSGVPNLK
jgi:N-acetylglucosamine kinase-like BadF-type ATPase